MARHCRTCGQLADECWCGDDDEPAEAPGAAGVAGVTEDEDR